MSSWRRCEISSYSSQKLLRLTWFGGSSKHLPEKPLYVLGIVPNVKWFQFRSEGADSKLVHSLTQKIVLPGEGFIVAFNSRTKKIAKKTKKIAGSRIYQRLDG